MKFGGPPHPIHGNTPYTAIRRLAQEVCEKLFGMNHEDVKANRKFPPQPKYVGLGSSGAGGGMQGFGSAPPQHNKTIGETILSGIEKLGTKLAEGPEDRQAAWLAKLELSASSCNYQPPEIDIEEP